MATGPLEKYKAKALAIGLLVHDYFGLDRSVRHWCTERGHLYSEKPRNALKRGGCLYCSLEDSGPSILCLVKDNLPTVPRWRLKFFYREPCAEALWWEKFENGLEAYLRAEEIDRSGIPKFRKYLYRVNPMEN
jgi:hypothetical protein